MSVYVTGEMPSNDKISLKDLELLLDSKLMTIHSRLDDLFKKVDDNYKALQARLIHLRQGMQVYNLKMLNWSANFNSAKLH